MHVVGERDRIVKGVLASECLPSTERRRRAADLRGVNIRSSVDIRIDNLPVTDVRRGHSAIGDGKLASPDATPPVKPPDVLTAVMSPPLLLSTPSANPAGTFLIPLQLTESAF